MRLNANKIGVLTQNISSLPIHEVFPELRLIFAYKMKLNCEHLENLRKEFEKGGTDFYYSDSDCTA